MAVPDNALIELDGDSTVLIVLKPDAGGVSLLSKDDGTGPAGSYYSVLDASRNIQLDRPFVEAGTPGTVPLSTAAYSVLSCRISGTAVSHFVNGGAAGTDTLTTGTATNTVLRIGVFSASTDPMKGFIAEILVYNVALGTTDRQTAENYLKAKYGIA